MSVGTVGWNVYMGRLDNCTLYWNDVLVDVTATRAKIVQAHKLTDVGQYGAPAQWLRGIPRQPRRPPQEC